MCFSIVKLSEPDALIVLYLLVRGPASAYQIAKDFLSAGLLREPRSGFPGVVRVVSSRLQRLERDGYIVRAGSGYVPTDRVLLDRLRVEGALFSEELGWCIVFNANGHYVLFVLDELFEELPDGAIEQLFVLEHIKERNAN